MEELIKKLKTYNIHYSYNYDDDGEEYICVKACAFAEPIHSYSDWDPDDLNSNYTPYDNTYELLKEFEDYINEGPLTILDCEECCGCGDW